MEVPLPRTDYPAGSIGNLLSERGIECRGNEHGAKELLRDGVSLGWFTAAGAVARFLPEYREA
jgi:hypothetical protein